MVYMSGNRNSRNQSSIVNRTNVGGGVKKGGLAPSIGFFLSSNPNLIGATNTQYGVPSVGNFTSPAQQAWRRSKY
jgi:hypothetical protein